MRVLLLIGYGYGNWLIYIRLGGVLLFEKNKTVDFSTVRNPRFTHVADYTASSAPDLTISFAVTVTSL
jgi:hypothetical protein